jgi:hypothetical protein
MISQAILDYIKNQVQQGVDQNKIKADLLANGWSQEDLLQAFSTLNIAPTYSPLSKTSTFPVASQIIVKNKKIGIVAWIILLIVILLIGGGVCVFVFGINPFSKTPYSENNLLSGLLENTSKIKSGSYKVTSSVLSVIREENLKPFEIKVVDNTELNLKFKRDYERGNSVEDIFLRLETFKNKFPTTLNNLSSVYNKNIKLNDPLTNKVYEYSVKNGGKDFDLKVTFETLDAISKIKSAFIFGEKTTPNIDGQTVTFSKDSNYYFYLSQTPPPTFFESLNKMLGYLPPDLDIKFSFGITSDWGGEGVLSKWKVNIDAVGDLGDLTYKANIDAQKNDQVYYIKINNFPALFGLNIPKEQWIRVDPEELKKDSEGLNIYSPFSTTSISKFEEEYKKSKDKMSSLIKRIVKIADKNNLLKFKNKPVREKIGKEWLYRYDLTMSKDSVLPFYKELIKESAGTGDIVDTEFSKDIYLKQLESQEINDMLNYFETNSFITLWINNEGLPVIIDYSLKIVPPDTNIRLKEKEFIFGFRIELNDLNQLIKIEVPANSKSINDVIKETIGSVNPGGEID